MYFLNLFWSTSNKAQSLTSLPQKSNYHISKDSYDHIWLSSTEGLIEYDGLNTKVYKPYLYNMIGSNVSSNIYEDSLRNFWFSTDNALHYFDRKSKTIIPLQFKDDDGRTLESGYRILKIYRNFIICYYENQIGVYDLKKRKIIIHSEIESQSFVDYDILINDNALYLALLFNNEVMIYSSSDFKNQKLIKHSNIKVNAKLSEFYGIQWLSSNEILYNNNKEIIAYNINSKSVRIHQKYNKKIYDFMYEKSEDQTYLLTANGLVALSDENKVVWQKEVTHKGNLYPLHKLKDEFWYGEDGVGVFFSNKNKTKFQHYKLTNKEKGVNARGLFQDSNNRLWYCSRIDGIGQFDKDGDLIFSYNQNNKKSPSNLSFNLVELENNKLLSASGNDILQFIPAKNIFEKINYTSKKSNHFFGEIIKTKSGQIILVDWYNPQSLYELKTVKGKYFIYEIGKEDNSEIYGVLDIVNDTLYASINTTQLGIYFLNKNKLNLIRKQNLYSSVYDQTSINNEKFYTTSNGLYSFTNGSFIKINQPLLNQSIYAILEHDSLLYLSSNNGLISYNLNSKLSHQFTLADGLQELEFNGKGALKDSEGNFWFGGINGINKFDPKNKKLLTHTAPINISSIKIQGSEANHLEAYNDLQDIKLAYADNTIEFNFNGIDYSDPSTIKLKYQLSNYEKNWNELKDNNGFARYPNLPPGHYTLQILAANSDGIWNKEPKTIKIEIIPPFWMTWWFYCLSAIALFSITYYTIKSYYNRKLEKQNQLLREQSLIIQSQQAIEAERNRIASEMHDDLSSGLTTIRYLSDHAMTKLQTKEELKDIEKIANQSNSLIRNMSEIIWAMNSRFDNAEQLFAYIKRYASEYLEMHNLPLKFVIEHNEDINLSGEKRRNIFLVVKEILHNAVKYSKAESIEIKCSSLQERLSIKINEIKGIGFDPAMSENKGNGIFNMRQRMDKIGGSTSFEKEESGFTTFVRI